MAVKSSGTVPELVTGTVPELVPELVRETTAMNGAVGGGIER
jgi:hypothetical protein